jgi:alkyldihydroxyacetonephosphate synthase
MTPWIRWDAEPAPAEPAWRWLAQSLGMPALLATPARPRGALNVPPSRLTEPARQRLAALLAERLRHDEQTRLAHAATQDAAAILRLRGGDFSQIPDAVLRPQSEDEILAILNICAEAGIAIGGTTSQHSVSAIFDLGAMADIVSLDAVSGVAQVQAGIASAALAGQLAARGMRFEAPEFSALGHWVARGIGTHDVMDMRLATPKGLLSGTLLPGAPSRFGIVTAATLRVHAAPASTACLQVLFPDFASGLAAMRETQREGLAHASMQLSDAEETRFHRNLAAMSHGTTLMQRVADMLRGPHRPQEKSAALSVTFRGHAASVDITQKRFTARAKQLGASIRQGAATPDYRPLLLDRGVTVDRLAASATWSELPVLYAALRTALDQAMRRHAPRADAHGLVLTQITGARHDGADLACTFLYPRQLNDDVAQAQAVRQAALDVAATHTQKNGASDTDVRHAIAALLDPAGVLRRDGN